MKKKYIFLITFCWIQAVMASIPLSERREKVIEKSEASLSQHKIKGTKNLEESFAEKNQKNIIIFNDVTENYIKFKLLSSKETFKGAPVTIDLVKALYQKQTILCTKSLIANFYFLSHVWKNFLELEPSILHEHYLFLQELTLSQIENIKKMIIEINDIVTKSSDLDDLNSKIKNIIDASDIHPTLLKYLFIFKNYYEEIEQKLSDYNIYDVNDAYMLLCPHDSSSTDFSLRKINIHDFFKADPDEINVEISRFLNDAIKKVFSRDIEKSASLESFFKWNIFIVGHGSINQIIAGMPHQIFINFLNYFNNNLTNSVTILSCYSGGKIFKEFFGHEFFKNLDALVQDIKYPILFFGTFFSTVKSPGFIKSWQNYKRNFSDDDYFNFFKRIKDKDYFLALNSFFKSNKKIDVFNNYGAVKFPNTNWITVSDYRKDIFDITKVLIASTYPHYVLNIPDSKNIVLMDTNVMPLHIHINMAHRKESNQCKFLPVFYTDQNYAIDILRLNGLVIMPVDREKEIAEILFDLFDIKLASLGEPITIFIKQVFVDRYKINNILIELDKKQISFESINRPGMLILGENKTEGFAVEKIEPSKAYIFKIDEMKKRLDTSIASNGFLSGVSSDFIKELNTRIKGKIAANKLSKLNPEAKPFIPKIQPIQA